MKMRKEKRLRVWAAVLCMALLCTLLPVPAQAADSGAEAALRKSAAQAVQSLPDDAYDGYLVQLKPSAGLGKKAAAAEQAQLLDGVEALDYVDDCYVVSSVDDAFELAPAGCIEYIEPNYMVKLYDSKTKAVVKEPEGNENDKHLALMCVDKLWEYGVTGEDMDTAYDMGGDGKPADQIVIGIIDSGLDPDHEDIDYSHVLQGESFVSTATTADTLGHGTFVTGEILATRGNGVGIEGIANGVYVMPLKVFVSNSTSTAVIVNAVNYAVEQKTTFDATNGREGANISVINMSLGSESPSSTLRSAVEAAIDANIIVVCAAGNDKDDRESYPAQYAIGVGATDSEGERAYYSQILVNDRSVGWENKVWVSAPGSDYTSLWYTGEYYKGSGTSFSSPQVAALAAVAVSLNNDLKSYYNSESVPNNHEAFKQLLKQTARYKTGVAQIDGQDTYYGWGIVDFEAMITTLTDYSNQKGKESQVTFRADNGAGTALTAERDGLEITVRAYDGKTLQEQPIAPNADGSYTLQIGGRYQYTIRANKYTALTQEFTVLMPSRMIAVSLEGLDYVTRFTVLNTDGENVPNPTIEVVRENGRQVTQNAVDGSFPTKNGTYTYTITAQDYFPLTGSFTVNDAEQEYPEQKNPISVTLTGAQDICSVTVAVSGTDIEPNAEITLMDASGAALEPYADGAWKLDPGSYSYRVTSDYYRAVTGDFTVAEADKGTERVISAPMTARLYWAFVDVMPLTAYEAANTSIVVKDADRNEVEPFLGAKGEYRVVNGTYQYIIQAEGYKPVTGSFTMNGKILYIDVELEEGSGYLPGQYSDIETQYHDFSDVAEGSWYYEPVNFAVTAGLFQGVGDSRFAPDAEFTRAMLVRVLYNLAGSPACEVTHSFTDVPQGKWYTNAVAWAYANGITNGVSATSFAPDQPVTREQLAVMLYNYTRMVGARTQVSGDGASQAFADYSDISRWAENQVCWAYEQEIIFGSTDGLFHPQSSATRAQAAAMMARWLKNVL